MGQVDMGRESMGQVDMGEGDHRTYRYVGGRTWDSYGRGSIGQVDMGQTDMSRGTTQSP